MTIGTRAKRLARQIRESIFTNRLFRIVRERAKKIPPWPGDRGFVMVSDHKI
ncbi:hypothetical protein [Dongia deserti]|uniref:hypothetical protein n=1 Tax=Dongia deserti TaxID=2268030 RepID=UPI0013C3FE64|nr:hypothetical protein [Dongia deserti]